MSLRVVSSKEGGRATPAQRVRETGEVEVVCEPGAEWDAFVANMSSATVAHLSAWGRILRGAYGHRAHYLAVREQQELTGCLPLVFSKGILSGRRLRGLPMVHGGGPLAGTDRDRKRLLAAAVHAGMELDTEVVIHSHQPDLAELDGRFRKTVLPPKWIVDLQSVPPLDLSAWKKPSLHLVRSLKKSDSAGLTVETSSKTADLRAFYRLYLGVMRRRQVIPRSYRQFDLSRKHLPEHVFRLFVARRGSEVAAASVCYVFGDTVEIHYSASDSAHLCARPNHRLWWGVLEWAAANGLRRVDLGEATPGSALEDFKRQFLAVPDPEYRYDAVTVGAEAAVVKAPTGDSPLQRVVRHPVARRVWSRTPIGVTQLAGELALRYG